MAQRGTPAWKAMLWTAFGLGIPAALLVFAGILVAALTGSSFIFLLLGGISLVFWIPVIILVLLGFPGRARHKKLVDLANLLRTYRRIKIVDLVAKMGMSEMEVEKMVNDAVTQGMIEGYIDRQTMEFFTKESLSQSIKVIKCPTCGAPNDRVGLVGETMKCSSCGSLMPVSGNR